MIHSMLKSHKKGFPGGPVVKNPPCNAGDTSLIPGPGRSHMPWNNKACVPQLLSQQSTAGAAKKKRSHRNETSAHCNQRVAPTLCN